MTVTASTTIRPGSKSASIPLSVIQNDPRYRDCAWLTNQWTPRLLVIKRALDVLLSTVVLLATVVLSPCIALMIKLDSRGPVLYSQLRIGKGGHRFRIYKFRSMRVDAEANGALYAEQDDPRITRVGMFLRRTRLDELPQFWNILCGGMTLIGPRPERPENERMLEDAIPGFGVRTCVTPGLTGWAQIRAPYANTIEQSSTKFEYDVYYIRHASLWLDLRIAWSTVRVMLGMRGQ